MDVKRLSFPNVDATGRGLEPTKLTLDVITSSPIAERVGNWNLTYLANKPEQCSEPGHYRPEFAPTRRIANHRQELPESKGSPKSGDPDHFEPIK